MLKVATWNVNSIRARHDRLLAFLNRHEPDVVCLQELKGPEETYPFDETQEAGYHSTVFGQRTYNGVAIVSRNVPDEIRIGFGDAEWDAQARLVSARFGGLWVASVYVPNGKAVGSDKWDYKKNWYKRLGKHLETHHSPEADFLICGDYNVAFDDRDVADPERWGDSTLYHESARKMLTELCDWGLRDTMRLFHDGPGPYSWWDYRRLAFPRGDGLKIDHILATPSMVEQCRDAYVDRDERKGQKPSDHAPVFAEFSY